MNGMTVAMPTTNAAEIDEAAFVGLIRPRQTLNEVAVDHATIACVI